MSDCCYVLNKLCSAPYRAQVLHGLVSVIKVKILLARVIGPGQLMTNS